MKKVSWKKYGLKTFAALLGLAAVGTFASQDVAAKTETPKDFLVYYRAWRDKEMKGVNTSILDENWITMNDIPYGINYVNVFSYVPQGQEALAQPYFDRLKNEYEPNLHARGVKLIRGFDYSKLLNIKPKGDFPTEEEFDAYAKELIAELMTPWNLDGLDVDMETYPTPEEVKISDGVIRALSKYIGPKANNGTVFFYDTNNSNLEPIKNVKDCFDHVAYQQYGSNSKRTEKAVNDFSAILSPSKFMPGLTFPEEGDPVNRWYDTDPVYKRSNIYDVANFAKNNHLGGMFLYALDRDGRSYNEPDFSRITPSNLIWTKTSIQEVNDWTVDEGKEVAQHHLHRIKEVKDLSDETVKATEDKIQNATDLMGVNQAILGTSYANALNPTFDPTLEDGLLNIDLTKAYELIEQAHKEKNKTVTEALNELAAVIGGKIYTEEQVKAASDKLETALKEASQVKSGWQKENNRWFFYENNQKVTGWKFISNVWYYFEKDGAMVENAWKKIGNKWYFFNGNGYMVTGWRHISNVWYYFNANGNMVENSWKLINNKWYHFNSRGYMASNQWVKDKGQWYFVNKSGAMLTGWIKTNNKWYFAKVNGAILLNTSSVINGKRYVFDASGAWIR